VKRISQRHGLTTLTELNVTPLLDLAFVLLIIFMITTPLVENSIELVVPTSSTATTTVNPGKIQTISVDRNNVLKLNQDVLSAAALEARLAEMKAQNPELAVVIRPDKELSVQKFVAVMDVLQRVKISKVGVMTQAETAPASGQ